MGTLAVLYISKDCGYGFELLFGGRSAFGLCLDWIRSVSGFNSFLFILGPSADKYTVEKVLAPRFPDTPEIIKLPEDSVYCLLKTMSAYCREHGYDTIAFGFADSPFYDPVLTQKLLDHHKKYAAEYTFADCYPAGLAPEIMDSGILHILSSLAGNENLVPAAAKAGRASVGRGGIFDVIKSDINSFEVETVLPELDVRLYRLDFSCSLKRNALSCAALYEAALETGDFSADALCRIAVKTPAVLRTVPSFYNIQISSPCSGKCLFCPYPAAYKNKYGHDARDAAKHNVCAFMPFDKFCGLIDSIAAFSETAVVSVSLWGESLLHPQIGDFMAKVLSFPELSLLIETDGLHIHDEIMEDIRQKLSGTEMDGRLFWILGIDAALPETYGLLHGVDGDEYFEPVRSAAERIALNFPGSTVYEQFIRMTENEGELEAFYRYWKEHGHELIQKYDHFCAVLPNRKTADLTPVERIPCWHLRRDMCILADGTVPVCREYLLDGSLGSVFEESIETVWNRGSMNENLDGLCGKCDEYYTYNF